MIALFDGSTAIDITRPDATAGPIERAFRPENGSAGLDCAAGCGTGTSASKHAEAMKTRRSMRPIVIPRVLSAGLPEGRRGGAADASSHQRIAPTLRISLRLFAVFAFAAGPHAASGEPVRTAARLYRGTCRECFATRLDAGSRSSRRQDRHAR